MKLHGPVYDQPGINLSLLQQNYVQTVFVWEINPVKQAMKPYVLVFQNRKRDQFFLTFTPNISM